MSLLSPHASPVASWGVDSGAPHVRDTQGYGADSWRFPWPKFQILSGGPPPQGASLHKSADQEMVALGALTCKGPWAIYHSCSEDFTFVVEDVSRKAPAACLKMQDMSSLFRY